MKMPCKPILIGDKAPDFTANSTQGLLCFHSWMQESWCLLFSNPKGFSPVCSTELAKFALLQKEFGKRNVKLLGVTVDQLYEHKAWIESVAKIAQSEILFPLIADTAHHISELYGLSQGIDQYGTAVRAIFLIDPSKKMRAMSIYPASAGRNTSEILRLIDSLQLTDRSGVYTPVDWQWGEDCVIPLSSADAESLKKQFPSGWKELRPWWRVVAQPNIDPEPAA